MSYLIPVNEAQIVNEELQRARAEEAGFVRAIAAAIGGGKRANLISRDAQNTLDFGTATDQWNTTPLAVLNPAYSVFPVAAGVPVLAATKVAVFYRVGVETAPIPVSLLSFRLNAAAGSTLGVFDLEQLANKLEPVGYFSDPIVYGPLEGMNIVVTCRIVTALLARIQLGCLIIEPRGNIS